MADRGELQSRLQAAATQPVLPEVHVCPDKEAQYKAFAEVMGDVNHAGLHKLGVVGSEPFMAPTAPTP